MRDILIGIDAGTSVIKSVAFDLTGRQLATAALPNAYEAVGRAGSVQDLDRTWADAATTLKQLSDKIENLSGRVAAIAVTGQAWGQNRQVLLSICPSRTILNLLRRSGPLEWNLMPHRCLLKKGVFHQCSTRANWGTSRLNSKPTPPLMCHLSRARRRRLHQRT